MAPPTKNPEPYDADETLAANFERLLAGRSVNVLRKEMAARQLTIGSGAIQAAKAGSRGLRLETLQKFADFFGCTVCDMLRAGDAAESGWPFQRLQPEDLAKVGADVKAAAEDMLLGAARRAELGEPKSRSSPHRLVGGAR